MQSVSVTVKQKKYQKIYKSYVNDIYRICLCFLKDEKKAKDATEQVFVDFYKEFEEVDSAHIFPHLVHNAKRLATNEKSHEFVSGEVTE